MKRYKHCIWSERRNKQHRTVYHTRSRVGNPLVREIQNGYYILIDRQEDQETDILDRPSFNVTVGLYDTDTNTLYCCTLDT